MTTPQIDSQWLDYYALLDVPVGADEDTIRKRIGKVYAEAASNSDHRNLAKRQYFQALVERVLPQCRRVLLDAEWRARYDRQHSLHQIGDPAAQDYVAFIASMRGDGAPVTNESLLPQRAQDEINAARQVVETALSGAELELLPSQSVSSRPLVSEQSVIPEQKDASAPAFSTDGLPEISAPRAEREPSRRHTGTPETAGQTYHHTKTSNTPETSALPTPQMAPAAPSVHVETVTQAGEPARAKVITAQEAAAIRRTRASNPNGQPFAVPPARANVKGKPRSRVTVGSESASSNQRRLSPTSLNLMVAITGVLLTITIQRFASTPAVATSTGRTPIFIAVAPEMQSAIESAGAAWENTPAGADFDVIVQPLNSNAGVRRALGKSGELPDAWIPSNAIYTQRYNQLAPAAKRPTIEAGASIAQTPMVLVARSDRAGALRRRFPNHKISSWADLREAVMKDASGHFGLSDPRDSVPGAVARVSMAREWGQSRNQSPEEVAKNPQFWRWMAGYEENIPSFSPEPSAMIKDMVLGTTGRYWWAVSYESDALNWIAQGKPIELYYLPRTALADHPFCAVERVGAPLEVATGRANFARYLYSVSAQRAFLQSGLRPTEISPSIKIEGNPFAGNATRAGGVLLEDLPRDERLNFDALNAIQSQWSEFYG